MATPGDRVKESIRSYLDATTAMTRALSKMTRSDIERMLKEISKPGSATRDRVDDAVEELRARSRRQAEDIVGKARREPGRLFDAAARNGREGLADMVDQAANAFAVIFGRGTEAPARETTAPTPPETPSTSDSPEPVAAKKGPGKKAVAKRAPVAKRAASAKKAPAKTTAANKTTAAKKAPTAAKTTAAKKTPTATKTAAKKATRTATARTTRPRTRPSGDSPPN